MKINVLRIILNEMWQMRFLLQFVRLTFKSMIYFQIALLNISATISLYKPSTRVLLLPCFPLNTSFHFWSPHSCSWCSLSLKCYLPPLCLSHTTYFLQSPVQNQPLLWSLPWLTPLWLPIQNDLFALNATFIAQFTKSLSYS